MITQPKEQEMDEQSSDLPDEVLHRYLASRLGLCPRMSRADLDRLLTGDTRRRVVHARAAAVEWAGTEIVGTVEITSERLLITPFGLVYQARLSGSAPGAPRRPAPSRFRGPAEEAGEHASSPWTLYYLATPPPLLDPIADRVGATQLPQGSAVAGDTRFGHALHFPGPLDAARRRTLDLFFAHGISFGEPAGSADVGAEEVQQPGLDAGGVWGGGGGGAGGGARGVGSRRGVRP